MIIHNNMEAGAPASQSHLCGVRPTFGRTSDIPAGKRDYRESLRYLFFNYRHHPTTGSIMTAAIEAGVPRLVEAREIIAKFRSNIRP